MAQENTNATEGYQMKTGWGTIAMLISATGMGLVPLFSRWATRTDMFDGTLGLNAGDSIGALMACGRMGMGVLFFVILMVATHKVKTFKELKLTPAIALGGLMIGMSLACYVTSTLLTTVANAVLFIYTGPVICVLAARIFRKEPMSGLQWICLLVVFIGMLFGEGLLGFGVGGQFFGLDFSLETSTPEFPQKGVGDAFGLLSGLFYGLSMFFNGYRKDADTTARGVWNFIFAVLGAGLITIILNSLGSQPGMENWALSVHFTAFHWLGAVLLWIICGPIALGFLLVAGDANEVLDVWDQIKMAEKESADAAADVPQGLLDGVPKSFPALKQAQKISRKAASAGFEWETVDDVWAKVDEEVAELKAAYAAAPKSANGKVDAAADPAAVAAVELEMGDVLFSLVNVARKMGVQAEEALRATCGKFRARWAFMEGAAAGQGRRVEDLSMEEMEELWQLSKVLEGDSLG